ncbi:MAG: DUF4136 domain-containing protein [Clostridium sp.]|nr:DUF4136 domain-containing protein [Clostridium sp.]
MKRTFGLSALFAVMAAVFGACSPYTLTNSEIYNDADLADYHTFRLVTPADGDLPPGMEMVTYYNIAAAIREQLVERGFTEDPNSPLLVNIGLTVKEGTEQVPYTTQVPVYSPGPPPPPLPRPIPGPRPLPGPAHNGLVPHFIYPRAYYWPQYATVTHWVTQIYREGVLTMDLVNIREMKPLYSASVATILDNGDSELRNLSGIDKAVQVLFSKFPVPIPKH